MWVWVWMWRWLLGKPPTSVMGVAMSFLGEMRGAYLGSGATMAYPITGRTTLTSGYSSPSFPDVELPVPYMQT